MHDRKVSGQGWYARRATVLSIAALFFCCSQQLCAQAQPSNSPTSFTISGTVVNSVTHEPIGRAMVYSADTRYAAFTDSLGQFELKIAAVQDGGGDGVRFTPMTVLQAKKPGFLSAPGARGRAVVTPTTKEVTLSLVPEGVIAGQLKFPSSETADVAQVLLYRREVRDGIGRWQQLSETRARSDGEYRFAELRPGQYKVYSAEALDRDPLTTGPGAPVYGFPPRFFAAARDFAAADVIEVRAGETATANLTPERQRYFEVSIPLMGDATPDSGVSVAVHAQGHRGPGFELGYDPEHHAVRGSLPNGSYTVEASSYGPMPMMGVTSITIANGQVTASPITLAANPSIEVNVRAQLSGAENTQSQMQPQMPPAYVTLMSAEEYADKRGPGQVYMSQGSPLRLEGVKPGRYWVQIQPNASNLYAASVTSGMTDLLRAPLVVPVGASVPPIEVTMRDDGGAIEVTVEGAPEDVPGGVIGSVSYSGPMRSGEFYAMGGVSLCAIPVGGGAMRWFNSRMNGKYQLQRAPVGDYRVMAFDSPQDMEWRNPAAMQAYESKAPKVHVAAGETAKVTVKLDTSE
jgi:hypothetical protein